MHHLLQEELAELVQQVLSQAHQLLMLVVVVEALIKAGQEELQVAVEEVLEHLRLMQLLQLLIQVVEVVVQVVSIQFMVLL
jgi:hypothetical protein